jgi:DNA (cytosine-5)-methyltransferase 1
MQVRRLTPIECERLQGLPDNYTLIDWQSRASKKKIQEDVFKYFLRQGFSIENATMAARHPDGPRYKAIGNSMHVGCMHLIGKRIKAVDNLVNSH